MKLGAKNCCVANEFSWRITRISPIRQHKFHTEKDRKHFPDFPIIIFNFCRFLARMSSERGISSVYSWNRWGWSWARAGTDGIRSLLHTVIEWDGAFKARLCWSDIYLYIIKRIEITRSSWTPDSIYFFLNFNEMTDSKTLNDERREHLFKKIRNSDSIGWIVNVLSASELSASMLQT